MAISAIREKGSKYQRYSIRSTSMSFSEVLESAGRYSAHNIQNLSKLKQVLVDLDDDAARLIRLLPGMHVERLRFVGYAEHPTLYRPMLNESPTEGYGVYSAYTDTLYGAVAYLQDLFSPPVLGNGYTIAILDSGIRGTHITLTGKVNRDYNFTSSQDHQDHFNHGTSVAFCAAGGQATQGQEQGMAPFAKLVNMKVLDDIGEGDEGIVLAALNEIASNNIDHPRPDPLFISHVNLSLGAIDDGNPNNPVRVACNKLTTDPSLGTLFIYAAAGNNGPSPSTILSPATDPVVNAVGGALYSPYDIWPSSARGPTLEGIVKPDFLWFAVNRNMASSESDNKFVVKSGTSFSCPSVSGLSCLSNEGLERVGIHINEMSYEQQLAFFVPLIAISSTKPAGAPLEQDNTYGYGLLLGNKTAQGIAELAGIATGTNTGSLDLSSTISPLISGMMVIGMMGMMGKMMPKQ